MKADEHAYLIQSSHLKNNFSISGSLQVKGSGVFDMAPLKAAALSGGRQRYKLYLKRRI
jgi:hypothetical protein